MFSELAKRTALASGVEARELRARFAEALKFPLRRYKWRNEIEKLRAERWIDSLKRQHQANGASIVNRVCYIYEGDVLRCVYRVPDVIIKSAAKEKGARENAKYKRGK